MFTQIARCEEFVDEFAYTRVIRFQGERDANANETPPRPLLFARDEHGYCGNLQRAIRGRFACMGGPRELRRSVCRARGTTGSTSLLDEAVCGDCVDGIIPPLVVTLERGIIRSSERFY
jgi:hypothetical protein